MPQQQNVGEAKANLNAQIQAFEASSAPIGDPEHPLTEAIESLVDAKIFEAAVSGAGYAVDLTRRYGDDD